DDPLKDLAFLPERGVVEHGHCFQRIENGRALEGRAPSDRVEAPCVPVELSASLRKVAWDGQRSTPELVDEVAMPLGNSRDQLRYQSKELRGGAVGIEPLEAEHAAILVGSTARQVRPGTRQR